MLCQNHCQRLRADSACFEGSRRGRVRRPAPSDRQAGQAVFAAGGHRQADPGRGGGLLRDPHFAGRLAGNAPVGDHRAVLGLRGPGPGLDSHPPDGGAGRAQSVGAQGDRQELQQPKDCGLPGLYPGQDPAAPGIPQRAAVPGAPRHRADPCAPGLRPGRHYRHHRARAPAHQRRCDENLRH